MEDQPTQAYRVMIVDANELLRRGIRDVLSRDRRYRFTVVADVARIEDALDAFRALDPDVTFLALPPASLGGTGAGTWCLHEIVRFYPTARVIGLLDSGDLSQMLAAIQAGARGVLVRDAPASALREAARDVIEGGAALDLRLADTLFDYLASTNGAGRRPDAVGLDPAAMAGLSPREREVLRALAQGSRNKEIAAQLGVSVGTVKTHLRHIFRKLKVADRTSAVLVALHAREAQAA